MITYKDKTWCEFYTECIHGTICRSALTPVIREAAIKWFGDNAPIAVYLDKPKCFEDNENI